MPRAIDFDEMTKNSVLSSFDKPYKLHTIYLPKGREFKKNENKYSTRLR